MNHFKILKQKNGFRRGLLKTAHGNIKTPFFMPIATRGSVKFLHNQDFKTLKNQILLSNTYHLYLRPGLDVLQKAQGLHAFMNWHKPILTDSGGYQVYSLKEMRQIQARGVKFKSTYDGSNHFFTPEKVIDIQKIIGSDIMMVLDECTPYPCAKDYATSSIELTTNWAERSYKHFKKKKSSALLFAIVQGSTYKDLREKSARDLTAIYFDGFAIGGLAVGEPVEKMYESIEWVSPLLPEDKPRYLMGVGQPEQILEAVRRGVDMFDCVLPTRNARHGFLYANLKLAKNLSSLKYDILRITKTDYRTDLHVLDKNCSCTTCKSGYSRAYIRHLFSVNEPLAMRLCTVHNVNFYLNLMRQIRDNI
ncbi:MAG: tRNA guanosine(34) transglycosylase Tgt [Patescibacteria group bacterium]